MLPNIQVESVKTIRQDSNHNAFTDLCRYRGRFYLTFRSCPDGHGYAGSSCIVILGSENGEDWTEEFKFVVPGRDVRDPHFIEFQDTLFLYTGTWLMPDPGTPMNLNDHLGYGIWTEDGNRWNGPQFLEGTYGHYIWRAAVWGERVFLCGRRRRGFQVSIEAEERPESIESAMLVSDNGFVWSFKTLFAEQYGDETAFVFEEDGSILALVRDGDSKRARVCRAKAPWNEWTRASLKCNVGGPLLVQWGDNYLVGGRQPNAEGTATMTLSWLVDDTLKQAAVLPSGGDCSYPGFVPINNGRGLLSYYSSHEGPTSIYLAKLNLQG